VKHNEAEKALMDISRIAQKDFEITLTAKLANGQPADARHISVALTPAHSTPSKDTIWLPVLTVDNIATFRLCGAQAPESGALVAPIGKTRLYARSTDSDEVEIAFIDEINCK
jgi:hypothetical protein